MTSPECQVPGCCASLSQSASGAHALRAPRKSFVRWRGLLVLRPALYQLVIGNRLALRLLIGELRPGGVLGAEPLRGVAHRVQPWAAIVIDVVRHVHRLHAG